MPWSVVSRFYPRKPVMRPPTRAGMDRHRPRPLRPPRRVLVTVASLVTAIVLVRAGLLERLVGSIVDHAVENIVTLIMAFAALMALISWFLFESGHSSRLKRLTGWGLLAAVCLACGIFRIENVSGDMIPRIVFRWSPARDRLLPQVSPDAGPPASSWTAAAGDFPRFLGPDGSAGLDRADLDPDWGARPPRLDWRQPIGAGWSGFATCGDHATTLEQRGDEEVISCRSIPDGRIEWVVAVPARHQTVLGGVGPRSTPTIDGGVVYATGATGWLHAVDGATGAVLWKKDVLADLGIDPAGHYAAVAWGRAGSPLVTDALVIVPGGGPRTDGGGAVSLAAYDKATGARRWLAGDEQIAYTTPVLATMEGRSVVIAVNESHVAAYDPADGSTIWQFGWPGHSNSDASCSQPHVLDGRRILVSKGYGVGAAVFEPDPLAADGFTAVWRQPGLLKTKFTNVTVHDGHAYGLSDGILECVSVADGKRRWKGGRYGQGQVLRVGDLLLVQAETGEVVLVDCVPRKHVVRGRLAALDGQTWNNPCLAGDRLLVRNAEQAACYELPRRDPGAAP